MEDKSMAFNLMPCHNDSPNPGASCERINASSERLVVKAAEDDWQNTNIIHTLSVIVYSKYEVSTVYNND